MALPVKDIPVLKGKDARRFEAILKANEGKKVPKAEYDRAKSVYDQVMKISPQSVLESEA